MRKLNNKGVTLIEITIAISLVVMLSSVAFTNFSKVQEKAKINTDEIVAANLASATSIYLLEEGESNSEITPEILKTAGYINTIPIPQSSNGSFSISVVGEEVVVSISGQQVYPKQNISTSE